MQCCCPADSHPPVEPPANYVPKGTLEKIEGVDMYVVGEKSEKAIVVLPDLFGMNSGCTKQLCDRFAEKGFFVVMPDNFVGSTFREDGSQLKGWRLLFNIPRVMYVLRKYSWKNVREVYEDKLFPYLKKEGVNSIGTASFCFGGYIAGHLAAYDEVKATVCYHPSTLQIVGITGENWKEIYGNAKSPFLVCSSSSESKDIRAGGAIEDLLKKSIDTVEFVDYPTMKHGFVNRGDQATPEISEKMNDAFDRGVEFFEKLL